MSERALAPPSGYPPPTSASLGAGKPLDLLSLSQEICRRYRQVFPDEAARFGDAGYAWCIHDNQHLLNWGASAVLGYLEMNAEVSWLAKVLESRDFPLDRLARNLDIGAEVVLDLVSGTPGEQLAGVLADAAAHVRSRDTFLD